MKTKHYIPSAIASLLLAVAMTSCNEEYAAYLAQGTDAVRIASATVATQTRAAAEATAFADGDAFSLSTSADGNGAATYTLNGNDWNSTPPLYWSNDSTSDFYAAYPSTANYNSFILPTDQSDGTAGANYMTAKQTNVDRLKELNLEFCHKTAMVVIKVKEERAIANEGKLTDAVIRSPHNAYADAAVTGEAIDVAPPYNNCDRNRH